MVFQVSAAVIAAGVGDTNVLLVELLSMFLYWVVDNWMVIDDASPSTIE